MASTLDLLKRLADHGVECVLVGGMAGVVHGCGLITEDIDVCAPMSPENLTRLLTALKGLHPRHRMRPDRLPLPEDPARLHGFKNLYIETDLGQIDVLGEIAGLGAYDEVAGHAVTVDLDGRSCRVLSIDSLIQAKRAMGRPQDLRAVQLLEAVRDRLRGRRQ